MTSNNATAGNWEAPIADFKTERESFVQRSKPTLETIPLSKLAGLVSSLRGWTNWENVGQIQQDLDRAMLEDATRVIDKRLAVQASRETVGYGHMIFIQRALLARTDIFEGWTSMLAHKACSNLFRMFIERHIDKNSWVSTTTGFNGISIAIYYDAKHAVWKVEGRYKDLGFFRGPEEVFFVRKQLTIFGAIRAVKQADAQLKVLFNDLGPVRQHLETPF